ncbi:KR domain-containing protein [Micromonospora sp. BRA006-A]|nr:KR domain-containing protein [Micromonospora sp. BRA006-A]
MAACRDGAGDRWYGCPGPAWRAGCWPTGRPRWCWPRGGAAAPGAAELVAESGAVRVGCDVTDRAAVEALVSGLPELTAVVHTAGVIDDGVLDGLDLNRMQAVLDGKVRAARVLHEATAHRDLDAFVLFSSLAGVIGSAGQGNYAAANAYLDAFAAWRRDQGLPATAIAWGAWAEDGMAAALTARLARGGSTRSPPPRPSPHSADWSTPPSRRSPSPPSTGDASPPPGAGPRPDRRPARGARRAHRSRPRRGGRPVLPQLADLVRTQAAVVLGYPAGRPLPERTFRDLGFDSLTAVELRNRLTAETGMTLPATLVFDHPTVAELAAHLHGLTAGHTTGEVVADGTGRDREPIAIVAMSCRFPGGSPRPSSSGTCWPPAPTR